MGEMNKYEMLATMYGDQQNVRKLVEYYNAHYPELVEPTKKLFAPGEPTYYWFARLNDDGTMHVWNVGGAWRLTIGKDSTNMLHALLKHWGADCAGQFWFCKNRHVWARELCDIITFQNMTNGQGAAFSVLERGEPQV